MKKILSILLLIACVLGFSNINVSATTIDELQNEAIEKREEDGTIYLTLEETTSENIEIKAGEKVALDLNGHTLTNTTTSGLLTVDLPTIKVAQGGTLTIKGKGNLTRTNKYSSSELQQPIIDNSGTLNLNLDDDANILVDVAAVYGIINHASGTLNMTGGRVSTMHKLTYGLWNEGTAIISGGRFDQSRYPIGDDDYADAPAVVNYPKASLTITGGQFINLTGQDTPTVAPTSGSETTITGGKFEYQDPTTYVSKSQNMSAFLPAGYTTDKYGNVLKNEPTSEPTEPTTTPATTTEPEEETRTVAEPTANTETTTPTNPQTLDNVLVYVGLATISLGAVGCAAYKIRKRVNS